MYRLLRESTKQLHKMMFKQVCVTFQRFLHDLSIRCIFFTYTGQRYIKSDTAVCQLACAPGQEVRMQVGKSQISLWEKRNLPHLCDTARDTESLGPEVRE